MPRKPFWRTQRRAVGSRPVDSPAPVVPTQPNPDHAWKTLALMNEWIRHADAKAGVTLAFTGVLATMTFNLVKDFQGRDAVFDILVVLACALLVLTGALCGLTLVPRTTDKREDEDPDAINHLFFVSIYSSFRGERQRYSEALRTLIAEPDELTKDLAYQIHANARIATVKTTAATWAIRSALVAGASVAVLAIFIGITNN